MKPENITGIVLAGGKSSRMGTDKSLMQWEGKAMIEHAIATLKPICNKVVISSNQSIYNFTDCETWPDEISQQAPIIGIYSCLKRSETNINLFLSCDMPLVGSPLFLHLLSQPGNFEILIPSHSKMLMEPLCGIYKKTALPAMEKFIQTVNYKLYEFIESAPSLLVQINSSLPFYKPNMFSNINTLDDYSNLNKLAL